MNKMNDRPEGGREPDIILIALERKSYYMFKGEDFLNQLLLVDGVYPKPVLCVHFETILDCKRVMGDAFSPATAWGIHPEIIKRLRATKVLVETDA